MEEIKWFIDHYGTASLLCTTLLGLILKFRKFIKNVIRTIILSNNFHNNFGDSPADVIKMLHEDIQKSHDILEVRMRISERYLKIGLYVCDTSGKAIWLNDVICDMFGLDSRDMLGFGWLEAIHPRDRERVNEELLYAINKGIAYNSTYTICNHRDNVSMRVKTTALSVVNDKDKIICYVGYLEVRTTAPLDCEFNGNNN